MTLHRPVFGVAAVCLLVVTAPAAAQVRDAFAGSVAAFVNLVGEGRGDDQSAVAAALEAMTAALGEWDAAIAGVEAGLAANIGGAPAPVAARMRTALGAAYLERGRVQEALAQFELAAALDPAFVDVRRLRGTAHALARAPEEAAAAFRSAWLADPGARPDTAYLFLRASSLPISPAERAQATAVLLAAAGQVPTDRGPVFSFMTPDLLDEGALEAPVFAPVRYAEGLGLLREGRYDEALVALRRAAQRDDRPSASEDERRLLARADALVGSGDLVAAREAYHEATVAVPGSGLAHWALGQLHVRFADERSAARSFEAAAALGPVAGARHVHAALGRLYHNQLELALAAQAYERRVASAPNDAPAHTDLGDMYRAQDRLDEALVESLAAALLDPSSAQPFAQAGQVLASAGRDDEAVTMLEAAIGRDAGHLEARYALARALLRVGRADAARAELQTFQQLQANAMAEERRRFEENARRIDATLAAGAEEPPR